MSLPGLLMSLPGTEFNGGRGDPDRSVVAYLPPVRQTDGRSRPDSGCQRGGQEGRAEGGSRRDTMLAEVAVTCGW
jgi:hypothetical protein